MSLRTGFEHYTSIAPCIPNSLDITPIAQTEIAPGEFVVPPQEPQEDRGLDRKSEAVSFEAQPCYREKELVDEKHDRANFGRANETIEVWIHQRKIEVREQLELPIDSFRCSWSLKSSQGVMRPAG